MALQTNFHRFPATEIIYHAMIAGKLDVVIIDVENEFSKVVLSTMSQSAASARSAKVLECYEGIPNRRYSCRNEIMMFVLDVEA